MSDRELLGARIPPELKRLVDADTRSNQDIVEAALWREFGGRKKSALEAKKEHKLDQLEAIDASIESEKDERRRVKDQVEAINAQIETIEEEGSGYEDDIVEFLNEFANSRAVFPRYKSEVTEISETHAKSLKQVVSDIKDYAETHEYDIEDDRWTDDFGDGMQ